MSNSNGKYVGTYKILLSLLKKISISQLINNLSWSVITDVAVKYLITIAQKRARV